MELETNEETLRIKSGSCRDFAWLLIHVLRHFGLAARFVSGYIVQLSPDVKSLDGPSGPEKILQIYMPGLIYLPGAGSGFCKRRTYSIVHYESSACNRATEKCEVSFFENTVTRIHEPRNKTLF
jgi:hypothetical protein